MLAGGAYEARGGHMLPNAVRGCATHDVHGGCGIRDCARGMVGRGEDKEMRWRCICMRGESDVMAGAASNMIR